MLLLISFVWRWEIPRDHARKNVEFQRIMQSTVKQDIFTCAKLFQNILFSKPFSNMQNLNKIKYFTPGKMHRKTYSFTSLILHPGKITWPQEWLSLLSISLLICLYCCWVIHIAAKLSQLLWDSPYCCWVGL